MGFFDFLFGKKKESQDKVSCTPNQIDNIIGKYFSLEQIRQVPMGEVRLQPIDARLVCDSNSQELVATLAKASPDVKKYLPNMNLSSTSEVAKFFRNFYTKTEFGYGFGYAIKMGDDGYLGFIFVHTPDDNKFGINFPKWTIDFCLFEPFRGHGIMLQSLSRVLYILKSEMGVREVYAYVDESNHNCLKFLSYLPFDLQPEVLTDHATGNRAKLFCCPLHSINFQRR